MIDHFIKNGLLTWKAELVLGFLVVLGIFGIPFFDLPLWLAIPVGLVALIAGGILMFEGRASALGLKPFTNDPLGWRKAKQSYKEQLSEQGDKSELAQPQDDQTPKRDEP